MKKLFVLGLILALCLMSVPVFAEDGAATGTGDVPPTTDPATAPTETPAPATTTAEPTPTPTVDVTMPAPTESPTAEPTTAAPTATPTVEVTTPAPTESPTAEPTTAEPTATPTADPTTVAPTESPTAEPTTAAPTATPTAEPTAEATTVVPTATPTPADTTVAPTATPTAEVTTVVPTATPTAEPTTIEPTATPTPEPTLMVPLEPAKIWTDKADYFFFEFVTIYGTGFTPDATVTVTLTTPTAFVREWTVVADGTGAFETLYTAGLGEPDYIASATDGTITASTAFTDAASAKVNFATSGLPSGTSVSVTYNGLNNGGNSISGTKIFSSAGPSGDIATDPGSSFTFSYPGSLTTGSTTYNLQSTSPTSPYTTGADKSTATITGTYAIAPHNVNFATSGLPSGFSLTISWTKTNPAGNPASGSTAFTSPGPSSDEGTKSATTFTYSGFPDRITVGSDTYNLVSQLPASGFTTGATGGSTTVTATYELEIVTCDAPSITTHPSSASKFVGDSVTFSVDAAGTAPLSYQWYKGTTQVGTDSNSYKINSVATGDADDYTVMVSGDCGDPVTSNKATLNVYSLEVTKTADVTYSNTYSWSIEKSVGKRTLDLAKGESESVQYTIHVDPSVASQTKAVSGNIEVKNPAPESVVATIKSVTDVISDPTSPIVSTVTCPDITFPYSLAGGATLKCTYSSDLPDTMTRTNTATATLQNTPTTTTDFTGSANVLFPKHPSSVLGTIHVTDSNTGVGPWIFNANNGDSMVDYSKTFSCNSDAGDHQNTATITETKQSDSATVTVNCYDLEVTKTANPTFTRTSKWSIEKSVDKSTLDLFNGDKATSSYTVNVDQTGYTDSDWGVNGNIVIHNPTAKAETILDVTDLVSPDITSPVTCPDITFPYDLAAGATLICSYKTSLSDAATRTNTATVTLDANEEQKTFTGTADVVFVAPTTEVNNDITVTDSIGGKLGTLKATAAAPFASATYTYSKDFTCNTDAGTHPNTATITETGQTADKSVNVNCYAPVVTKTAAGTYDERHEWDVTKTVSPKSQSAFAGDTVSYEWTVGVTESLFDENFDVAGEITVVNPAPMQMIVGLTDKLSDNTVAAIGSCSNAATYSSGSLTIPASTTTVCSYAANDLGYTNNKLAPTDNTATAVLNTISYTASDPIEWTANVIRESATLDDDQNSAFPVTITDSGTWTYTEQYACSSDKAAYTANKYSYPESNTATVKSGATLLDSSKADTSVDCYIPDVSKDASTSFKRTWDWEITKDSDGTYSQYAGQSVTHGYKVTVTPDSKDSDIQIKGAITVVNPNPEDALTVALSDTLVDGSAATIDSCTGGTWLSSSSGLTVPAGGTASCDYAVGQSSITRGTNTATATLNGIAFTGTKGYTFGDPNTETKPVITVDDSNLVGESWSADRKSAEWIYTKDFACSNTLTDYTGGKYSYSLTNTATINEEIPVESDTAKVDVNCYRLVINTLTLDKESINENDIAQLSGTFTDDGPAGSGTHYVEITWGDGSTEPKITLADGAKTFGPVSHQYLDDPDGTTDTYTISVKVTNTAGILDTMTKDITVNNVAPTLTLTPATAQTVQYSDKITDVKIEATDVTVDKPFILSTTFTKDGVSPTSGLPSGLGLSDVAYSPSGAQSTGTWTLSGKADVAPGTYVISIKVTDKDEGFTTKDLTITVNKEAATIALTNPIAYKVASAGGKGAFSLIATVQETQPDLPTALAQPGNINKVTGVKMTLAPVGAGSPITKDCNGPDVAGTGYDTKTFTCDFADVPVNTYALGASIVSDYYTATPAEDVVMVYDPSLGFTTGGGWFYWPGTTDKTNFGYTMSYGKNGANPKGSLLLIRHLSDGSIYRLKSNALSTLTISKTTPTGAATFTGKSTYLGNGMTESVGNYNYMVYVEDNNEPGTGQDRFWIQVTNGPSLTMTSPAVLPAGTGGNAVTISGGNIVVPHTNAAVKK